MLTKADLESAFKVHFDEMDKCEEHKCYWALLHLVVILPDICGALESSDGIAKSKRYKKWCGAYLSDGTISSDEWYAMRCILLHQGTTLSRRGRYRSYSLGQPTTEGIVQHWIVETSSAQLHLNVGKLKTAALIAIRKWFQEREQHPDFTESKNVQRHMASLAQVRHPSSSDLIHGPDFIIYQSTASSAWHGGS